MDIYVLIDASNMKVRVYGFIKEILEAASKARTSSLYGTQLVEYNHLNTKGLSQITCMNILQDYLDMYNTVPNRAQYNSAIDFYKFKSNVLKEVIARYDKEDFIITMSSNMINLTKGSSAHTCIIQEDVTVIDDCVVNRNEASKLEYMELILSMLECIVVGG